MTNERENENLFIASAVFARERSFKQALTFMCDTSKAYADVAEVYDTLFQIINDVEVDLRLGVRSEIDKDNI